ncbi:hypothetical protein K450DRAFT_276091 [Umbelopsis ramanniana AG]|uniref:Uncharacterized protein n=1 Tax=Umbelopsis ramanniana AG TaxID=1314678 RepID=A0AAD5E1Q2_UMBRA|nr:uncharacterized protein K450DRAFT_276091 [Umbelopsis ramanniana AG]KAI8574901.1 hypothetical protein K450DRAFT_276091 [Umbelopsis ramanniana AG]
MAVDIPPLDDQMDIDEPFELEVVGCSLAPSDDSCLPEGMEICPPSPALSSRVLRFEEAPVDRCVLPEGMDVCPTSPARSSGFLPLAGSDTPSVHFVGPSATLAAPPAPSAFMATHSAPSATTLATPSAPYVSVARAAAMYTAEQYRCPASPPSRDDTPPKASRDGTPLGNENQLSPVNGPVAPPEDVEDVNRPDGPEFWLVPGPGRSLLSVDRRIR